VAEVTVGIDIGTTAVKAVAVDGDGRVVDRARVTHRVSVPSPDRLEHDAGAAWRRGPKRALAAVAGHDVRAVSVVAMVPSLTAVDRRGIPRTSGLLYGDGRGGGGAGEAEGFLRWTAGALPEAHGYWQAQAVANHALGGEGVVDTSVAASCMPVFSGESWTWDDEVCARAGARTDQLPRVAGMGEGVGRVEGAVLDAGGVDAVGEQLVAGANDEGDVLVICGTTLIVWVVSSEWREVEGLLTVPHMGASGLQLIGGPSNAGGLFLNWAGDLLRKGGRTDDPGRVPIWSPYPRGERTPIDDPTRRAVLHDLDLTMGPAEARRASFEAAAFVVRRIVERSGVAGRRIVATGGGIRVDEWVDALAYGTGLPVDLVAVPEGAALGAAFLARMAAGLETAMTDAARWASIDRRVEPDERWQRAAASRYDRFRELAG
jgi:xylulokinase